MTNLQPSLKAKLVDVGCGNGALTNLVGGHYKKVLGIDPSDYLIEIAKEFFENRTLNFFVAEAIDYTKLRSDDIYDHALMYGVSSFLSDEELEYFFEEFLESGGQRLFIGAVRDLKQRKSFYKRKNLPLDENCKETVMGIWRDISYFYSLASSRNCHCSISKMPKDFYASTYYFDVLLVAK